MANALYWLVCAAVYAVVMALLIRELRDIVKHPEKHNETPGWQRYRHSFWFEHPAAYRGKLTSKHYWAGILTIPLFLLGWLVIWAGGLWLQRALFIPEGVLRLKTDGVAMGVLLGIFWLIGLESWLTYHCSHPMAIALSLHMFGGPRRTQKLKASVLMVIATALFIPAMALGLESYGYATEEGFVISRYFSATETRSAYGDCTAQTSWRFNRGEDECYFSYTVTLPDGATFDLFDACEPAGTDRVHRRLADAGVMLQRGSIDGSSLAVMRTIEEPERLAWLMGFFVTENP